MSLDLERGYTSVSLRRIGVGRHVQEMPEGGPHAVRPGERVALCGVTVRDQPRLAWPWGAMERPCPRCAELVQELESAD